MVHYHIYIAFKYAAQEAANSVKYLSEDGGESYIKYSVLQYTFGNIN